MSDRKVVLEYEAYKKIKKKTGGKIFPPVKSSGHISYINMIFIFLNYSTDFNRIRTDL